MRYTNSMKHNYSVLLLLAVLIAFTAYTFYQTTKSVQTSEPPVIIEPSPDENTVPQNENPQHPLIALAFPQQDDVITSPLTIMGEARGNWFFEATFPVVLTDWNGLIIAEGFATAQEDWMTEEFVPFEAELTFTPDTSVSDRGFLILQKSNPSDVPENDDAYEITIYFE